MERCRALADFKKHGRIPSLLSAAEQKKERKKDQLLSVSRLGT
eukprot:SAG31_NODE_86_length_26973_cov_16.850897_22_plen_43_part_00